MTSFLQRGAAAVQTQNMPEALVWFEKAVAENAKDAQAHACLGQTLCWLGRRDEGVRQLHKAGQILLKNVRKTRDISQALGLIEQLQFWNDYQGALELGRQAVQINNSDVRGFQLLALSYSRLNQKALALSAGKQALKLAPNNAMLTILVATLEMAEGLNQPAKLRLAKVLQHPLSIEEKFRTHKELARLLDKMGEYDLVFSHLTAAGELSGQLPELQKQDPMRVPNMIETNIKGFDQALLNRWPPASLNQDNQDNRAPIFLIGFMRSGTTLTQEVLGGHPDIFVADETDLIYSVSQELERMVPYAKSQPERLRTLDLVGVKHLRQFYWDRANKLSGDKLSHQRFLDKTTMNTLDLGLINCLFPDAKVIFVIRDPRDVCLSCFMQTMTPAPSTVQLLTWEGTAHFYAQVMKWWQHIKAFMPAPYLEFCYEDAVTDFETTFKTVFEFLELDWDPSVIDFHRRAIGKQINSPSFSQVSQPLYTSSVARWQPYEKEFEAVAEQLQPYIDAFGYGNRTL
ncbi:sulfotransferase [Methylicorpusculum oleiharenae]|uniref:tetratricopeptide repeat-containing sulfotransferase family protein n=1 Tax=Methylicorpusculum oleiharenae TaxID=1338687 RepID=UPI001E510387|nr:sulfotransferase [Methylicorpusculum oleiharenae]MCD2451382.1 sulfotransferase [Methylicorpusculum oleiharenae]